ncbi:MAG: aspartate carbamoyltransferase regulatory subunit [Clostridia bacterium]|nr:aspartate carbamoyltransferase regulatory subunit [Clostridia bacterium]MBQ4602357.1 aspartate carbamoyltransferase regulatory subunit [Clostridia bacterium]
MNIDSIKNGYVIDHIKPGMALEIYRILDLGRLDCHLAIIKNAVSGKMGKKDIIKIDEMIELDLNVLGYIDPGITVNVVKNGEIVDKRHLELPEKITNVIKCKNPRCITSCEQELDHVFKLTDRENRVYRCIYCESKAK